MNDWEVIALAAGAFLIGFATGRILRSLRKANQTLDKILEELQKEGKNEDQSDSEGR
jgi:hypothetical protein